MYPYHVEVQPIFRPKEEVACGNLETVYYFNDENGWVPMLSQANVPNATESESALLSVLSVAQFRFNGGGFREPGEDPDVYWIQEAKMTFESFLKRMTPNFGNNELNYPSPVSRGSPVVKAMTRDSPKELQTSVPAVVSNPVRKRGKSRHYSEAHKRYYIHDEETGETRWENEENNDNSTKKMMKVKNSRRSTRHFSEEHNKWYVYDRETGETRWEEE